VSLTAPSDAVNGRNGYRPRDVELRFAVSLLPQISVGWFVRAGKQFGFKWRKIWTREEVGWVHANGSYVFQKVRKFNKNG
jgi:hypothetical protein